MEIEATSIIPEQPSQSVGTAGRPSGAVLALQLLALAGAAAAIVLSGGLADWNLAKLGVIATLTIASDMTYVETGSEKLKVSGSFLGMMVAAVLLGGAPAAIIGLLTIAFGWQRSREAAHHFRNNLAMYAWCPLIGGLFFYAATRAAHVGPHELAYYLLVLATFVIGLGLNMLGVVGYVCYLERSSFKVKVREALMPLLASELFSAVLTLLAVYVAVQLGAIGLGLFALVLVIFQYLAGQLLVSRRRSEELQRMATTDELTGLANRESFRSRVNDEIAACSEVGHPFSVMLIDLDRFKEINDTLGHQYGDRLLEELGPRLANRVGPGGLVARLGGDEFALLLGTRTDDAEELGDIAYGLLGCIQNPFEVEGLSLEISASIGISRFPADGEDESDLLRHADVAMYKAKEAQSGFKLYAAGEDNHSKARLSVPTEFRRALESEQLVVHYQPIVELGDLHVRGAESLVRWQHPEHGLLQPGSFIHMVEQTGLIAQLTEYVLERSIAQCAEWHKLRDDLFVSVNLSVRNLLDRSLPAQVERLLSEYGLAPDGLHLEITESIIVSDLERALRTIRRLSELGVRFSVDDFGTGYSSLAYLRRLPIAELKIDRSFVSPMLRDQNAFVIVRSTINMGHDLGLSIIAEGVEDAATITSLAELECDRVQGYWLGRPVAAEVFGSWIEPIVPVDRTVAAISPVRIAPAPS